MSISGRRGLISLALATILSSFVVAPAAHATSPVPGRFCKSADVGTTMSTKKYGVVVCKKDGDRARWKQAKTRLR